MLPNPLHPAVVHFPVVLVVLLPIFALGALWAVRRGARPRRAWAVPVAAAAALAVSAWAAVQTGEAQEERVERVVAENAMHEHEEGAERFLLLSGVLFLVTAAGLAGGTVGRAGRLVSTVGAFGLIAAGVQVGRSGGELVYEHGAASAYADAASTGGAPAGGEAENGDEDERD
jgi:uncharacterized membrane protein